MVLNVEFTALRRRASAGLAATADLIWPPSCPLCNQLPPATQGAAADFCVPCSAALSESEKLTLTACIRCGVPRAQTWKVIENSTSQSGVATQKSKNDAESPLKTRKTIQSDEFHPLTLDSASERNIFNAGPESGSPAKCPHCYNQKFRFQVPHTSPLLRSKALRSAKPLCVPLTKGTVQTPEVSRNPMLCYNSGEN